MQLSGSGHGSQRICAKVGAQGLYHGVHGILISVITTAPPPTGIASQSLSATKIGLLSGSLSLPGGSNSALQASIHRLKC